MPFVSVMDVGLSELVVLCIVLWFGLTGGIAQAGVDTLLNATQSSVMEEGSLETQC